jgi:hypothetical protein
MGIVQRCWGYTYEQGEERGGKEMDRHPLTLPTLRKHSVVVVTDLLDQ